MLLKTLTAVFIFTLLQTNLTIIAQTPTGEFSGQINPVTTGVPFLTIYPSQNINGEITSVPNGLLGPGIYGNLGLLALDTDKFLATIDYMPCFRELIPDINLLGLGACFRLSEKGSIGVSLRYFSLGNTTYMDSVGNSTKQFSPNEFASTLSYSFNIDSLTGIGIGFRFIYSNLTGGYNIGGFESNPGVAIAGDLGFVKQFPSRTGRWDHFLGVSLKNVGNKISYRQNSIKNFIPTTLTAGYGIRANLSDNQNMTLSYECSKLLVPTPPEYYNSADSSDINGGPVIKAGYDPNVGVFRGMIQSFYDAPLGFREELNEITHSFGAVYNNSLFTAGIGYFSEHFTKGNRKFLTIGVSKIFTIGLTDSKVAINLSFQVPAYLNYSVGQIIVSTINRFRLGINLSL